MNEETQSNEGPDLQPQIQAVKDLIDEGNYDAALARARGLLDDYPDRAEASTLLGEIYAARNMWPEAVEWYHEGVERGDSSATDKLREARDQLTRQLEQPGQPRRAVSASQAEQQRTKLWITLASAGAVVVIAVVIAALTFSGGPPSASEQPSARQQAGPSGAASGTRSPRSIARSATAGSQQMRRSATTATPQLPSGSGTEPTARSTAPGTAVSPGPAQASTSTTIVEKGPRSEQDMILESTLGSLTWPDGTTMRNDVSVAVDPFLGYAMITLEIPRNLASDNIADATARQAYSVATTAINTDRSLATITVRGVINTSSSQRRKRVVVAYRGNTSRESLAYWLRRGQSPTSQQLWTQVFAVTWWNPAIPHSGFE